ncbi:VTT domain-containing protein [Kitasatospora cineracea]|uniref:histidine kinase n=1 Tax=Kitasatospora cineracea TaxID=88074 RepID=A0A8G1UKB5_9ACTN|nr:VTT domain-containing protein [Kitasatospora cineracea]ROR45596.1 signal transduction histidine kinase [Kitasatospora cineracea]
MLLLETAAPAAGQAPTEGLAGWAAGLVETFGGPGAGLAVALENLFPPLPSEVILPLTGFAAGRGTLGLPAALGWTTAGSVAGVLALYLPGAFFGRERMHALWARLPLVRPADLERTEAWFARHGTKAVLLGRMVPVFRSPVSVPAGVERMPLPRFTGLTAVGSLTWNGMLITAGHLLGDRWDAVEQYVGLLALEAVRGSLGWADLAGQVLLGGVLLFLAVQGLVSLAALEARLGRDCFGPSEAELLRLRVAELADSRAAVLRAVDAERRRIERDLHDGVQQRLVALRLLLARAGRGTDPGRTAELLAQAHRESGELLTELREVAWRVHPSALDTLGLDEALAGLAARTALPLRIRCALPGPLPQAVRTAAYFVVSECVTNAAKHSGAAAVEVRVEAVGARLTVEVGDDGAGGADPDGGGLAGLRARVAALDGTLRVHSPRGGPTLVTAELPCA